ncbi:unnamed protein product [Zymoseptoria tritici ST99CH_1A5]|uniref:dipeptidyl-peptidase IV n=1 Tax=Zymoseptoria tritici ST99CH_1A5 TaxID=1276529 RepID=A0A1Y6LNX5_ZYMTR|nr:unnamed protein product [Zymoseptoria tritici ST99CH_1A5]
MALSTILSLSLLLPLTIAIDSPRQPHQPLGNGETLLTYNVTTPTALYRPTAPKDVDWISGEQDGQYITTNDDGALVLENIVTGDSNVFIDAAKVPEDYHEYWISPDQERVLWAVNYTKQYRHSYFADYLIQDVQSGETTPLVEGQVGDIQYAEFAPAGGAIALVRGNNLYIYGNDSKVTQITDDGGPDMFHAVPDWVYEEEIFGGRSALWFSPDGKYAAFLSANETGVGTFTIPYYMDDSEVAPPYPRELDLRYPKVGTTNPTVEMNMLDMSTMEYTNVPITAFASNDTVIGEVTWMTEGHSGVIYRVFNRIQRLDKHVLVNPTTGSSEVVRERDGTDGWLENNAVMAYVGRVANSTGDFYLDLSDESGWNHIYLYPVAGGDAIPITKGEWEVTAMLKVDTARSLVYYLSTEHHSTERHLYSINYATGEKTALVDDTIPGYWSASFSSAGDYYILSYQGPDVPYQEVYSLNSTTPLSTLVSNSALLQNISSLHLPNITYFELPLPSSNFTLNVMQRLPPNFDPTKQYPVLFTPYGGPNAQEVSKRFQTLTWRAYIASDPELEYITYTIDNRGTGFKGRAFRSTVTDHLGRLEAQDQIWAAKELLSMHSFLDAERVGIYGHSFGGYLSAKVLEADSDVFSFALIAAPVTDWRFYDSMYTERYMQTFSQNEAGYNETAVRNATGFANARGGFLIAHGTGDDNVHYQNSAALADLLVGSGVGPDQMSMMAFTDSDHSITYNGASDWLYKYYTKHLFQEKMRKTEGEVEGHQWVRRMVLDGSS